MVLQNEHQARFTAVYYANRIFPFSHAPARYICLLAAADLKSEVHEIRS
jgi:proteasome component ECM29